MGVGVSVVSGVGQRVTVTVGVIGVAVGCRVIVDVGVIGVAEGCRVIVGIGVSVGKTVPGNGVGVRVALGIGVFDGVSVVVGVRVGVAVAVGSNVLDGVGVKVAVEAGGFPMTVKKSTWYQSYPKNSCTWYSPGNHSSARGCHSEYP